MNHTNNIWYLATFQKSDQASMKFALINMTSKYSNLEYMSCKRNGIFNREIFVTNHIQSCFRITYLKNNFKELDKII